MTLILLQLDELDPVEVALRVVLFDRVLEGDFEVPTNCVWLLLVKGCTGCFSVRVSSFNIAEFGRIDAFDSSLESKGER